MSRLGVDALTVRRGSRIVIDRLTLRVEAGEIVGLVGANGTGKSTLLACIAGVLAPRDGSVTIDGASVWGPHAARSRARRALGYVPEAADAPGFLTGGELWALCATTRVQAASATTRTEAASATTHTEAASATTRVQALSAATRAEAASATTRAQVPAAAVRAGLGLDELEAQRLERMSLGQRRRACLGAAFVGPPALLVLDEPDNGLDHARLEALVMLVVAHAAAGGATLLASHDAAWLDRLDARRVTLTPTAP